MSPNSKFLAIEKSNPDFLITFRKFGLGKTVILGEILCQVQIGIEQTQGGEASQWNEPKIDSVHGTR